MTARRAPDIANYFSAAKQSQQLSQAEEEIQHLKAEIEQLRFQESSGLEAQIQILREQLQSQAGVLEVALDLIHSNPEQPRRTFLNESIEAIAHSMAVNGQLQPIILIQQLEEYLIFDGERRWRGAKLLGWSTIKAVIIPNTTSVHRQSLLTSLHREDLNPLDKAEAIVKEISTTTNIPTTDIPRILSTVVRRLKKQESMKKVVELIAVSFEEQQQGLKQIALSNIEQAVLSLLLELQLNPASVDANIFPMLSLAPDLKLGIRELGLKGIHALALQKLSAKNLKLSEKQAKQIRVDTTKQVLFEELSVSQTRKLVNEILTKYVKVEQTTDGSKIKQVSSATQSLQQISIELLSSTDISQLKDFQEVLRKKLAETEEVLNQRSIIK